MKSSDQKLVDTIKKDISREKKASNEQKTILAQTVYLGTIGIMISLPIVFGAYLGQWLDEKLQGFSVSWTISLIIVGVFVGAVNVFFFVRRGE